MPTTSKTIATATTTTATQSPPPRASQSAAARAAELPTPVLQALDLCKRFGGLRAVEQVNLSVAGGEIHAVIGPNGAGKSTLIAQLAGELKPDRGVIRFDGNDITALDSARRARLGLARCFQITSVIMPMTLLENVMLAALARRGLWRRCWRSLLSDRELRAAAMQALAAAGLEAHAECLAAHVSHGQHRQLEIAMALAMQPKLLLLDEPAAGMDAAETTRLVALLGGLKRKVTMLLIEHDMRAVFALADTISVLVGGRLIATDRADNIRANPAVQRAYLGEA